uniref:F-box domain-containing protein n=1 Tax=Steinernema glaseri TaxID=37863 RepID=A0A1I7YXL0_9BILA
MPKSGPHPQAASEAPSPLKESELSGTGDGNSRVVYTSTELMAMNPQRENPFWRPADVSFSHGFGDIGEAEATSFSEESCRPRRSRRSKKTCNRSVNIVDLLSHPIEAPPKPPISAFKIPLLPTALYENILNFGTQGDGFDLFRSPLPIDLFSLRNVNITRKKPLSAK